MYNLDFNHRTKPFLESKHSVIIIHNCWSPFGYRQPQFSMHKRFDRKTNRIDHFPWLLCPFRGRGSDWCPHDRLELFFAIEHGINRAMVDP
jgi:hypothetical protein